MYFLDKILTMELDRKTVLQFYVFPFSLSVIFSLVLGGLGSFGKVMSHTFMHQ